MRLLLLVAAMAVGVAVWLALRPERTARRGEAGTAPPAEGAGAPTVPPAPAPPADVPGLLRILADGDVTAADRNAVDGFRRRWVARGAEAVPEIENILRGDADAALLPAWSPGEDATAPPTLRAACILALAAIPGPESTEALARSIPAAIQPGEAFLAASELKRRGRGGWGSAALDQATKEAAPGQDEYQRDLVELAAGDDPDETKRRLLATVPRDADQRDPGPIARSLRHLPWNDAANVAPGLLEDASVTPRAKRRYAQALLARPEADAVRLLRGAWGRSGRPPAMRDAITEAFTRSEAWKGGDAARNEECLGLLRDLYPDAETAPGAVKRILRELEGR